MSKLTVEIQVECLLRNRGTKMITRMSELKLYFILCLLAVLVTFVSCSEGDRSPFYQKCVQKCKNINCTSDGEFTSESAKSQEFWSWLLQWGCQDECRYHCMWKTVSGYEERGLDIPKFHGKWPFRRLAGVQEPASAFSSILNLLTNVYMYMKIIREFPLTETPMILFWHCFAWVCINAWVWSTVFHTRDLFFTEFMDYASALSLVISLAVSALAQIFYKRRRLLGITIMLMVLIYYVEHVRYLYSGRIDYGYNMAVNIFFGAAGFALWLVWYWNESGRRRVRKLAVFTALSAALSPLEMLDFAPRLGWDSHALWHLATAPLPILFYGFVIDDLRYLRSSSIKSDLKLP